MSCKYSDLNGQCKLWNEDNIQFDYIVESCDNKGYCLVEEDEDPQQSCEDYEEQ